MIETDCDAERNAYIASDRANDAVSIVVQVTKTDMYDSEVSDRFDIILRIRMRSTEVEGDA